ncbi:hypothetical protein EJB05_44957 [Eragrostis curvula]|uniref:Glycosyltransferase 61 catalytic domain-containing protein n=1 Tax=Eragrostis curvula TaxID=38414 RepID=A0A5J9TIZ0_9POAL|nr:hypothetical protein EJB05_44957 [Eragrostis curvula]
MGTDSPAIPALAGEKSAARTVAQHRQAVVGFLMGFFLVLLLYTTVSSQFGPRAAIGLLQSTSAVRTNQNSRNPLTSPSSTPSNLTGGDVHVVGNVMKQGIAQKTDAANKGPKDEHIQHDVKNNKTEAKFGDKQSKTTAEAEKRVNEASDRMEEELIRQQIDQGAVKNDTRTEPGAPRKPICDLSDPRYDICDISGDVRTLGANRTVLYVPPAGEPAGDIQEWSIRDQSRKHLEYVNNVTVVSLNASRPAPACTSRHAVPAVVFAMNGLTSNPWHDFSDVLIPLFLTARAYDGEVQFLVSDIQPWFMKKYGLVLKNLSRYDVVDFNADAGVVRCYPHVTVGLRSHRDLGIDPARAPRNYTLLDFRLYIREVYSLPPAGVDIPYKFVNFPEIVAAAQDAGFEVVHVEPRRDLGVEEFSRTVDSCDVLMGAHGAGLTNFFFLRTNAVMLQVVPWGNMEQSCMRFYGGPAIEMRLRDVEYSITAEESTLYDKYGKDDPVVSDPDSIHRKGWQFGMRYYWIEQDIRLNVTRFAPKLQEVLRMLRD